ncbi:MAG: PAS-domain containing protein [Sedimentitalea sp.]
MEWALLAIVCAVTAGVAVLWLSPHASGQKLDGALSMWDLSSDPVWIFDGSDLVDASSGARKLIKDDTQPYCWASLYQDLRMSFPEFPSRQSDVQDAGLIELRSPGGEGAETATCEWLDGVTRVRVFRKRWLSPGRWDSETRELGVLRDAMRQAPYPIWCEDEEGGVSWSNAAHENLEQVLGRDAVVTTPLFPRPPEDSLPGKRRRVSLNAETRKLWFDVSSVPYKEGNIHYAVDVNAVVDAEIAQRNFVQTLAKTFAQLSIGLAIFDRNRQLALFNPALIDLTSLPADFLSGRPNLLSFFDQMRDQRMVPEPKDYRSWRQQITDLVEAASDGRYQETWTLPSGSVYSVSGRPHPDGAVAFLIEDITAEITLTRRFRSELELGQSILDQLDEAIAVFASDGRLTMTNYAYRQLWQVDPERSFAQTSVLDATRVWQERCIANPVWGEIRDFVSSRENRVEWWSQIQTHSGDPLICNVYPVQNGSTMIAFSRTNKQRMPRNMEDRLQNVAS